MSASAAGTVGLFFGFFSGVAGALADVVLNGGCL